MLFWEDNMNKNVITMKFFWIGIFICLVLSNLYSSPQNEINPYEPTGDCVVKSVKECRFFTRDLIINLEHSREVNVKDNKAELERYLTDFFMNYHYYEELYPVFASAITLENWNVPGNKKELAELTRKILEFIGSTLKNLDDKSYFFSELTINPDCIATFENDLCHSFVSITFAPLLTGSSEEGDAIFFLLSAGFALKYKKSPPVPLMNQEFRLCNVSVNWVYVSQYVYGGGPGGFPVPNPGEAPVSFYDVKPAINNNGLYEYIGNEKSNYPVDVYILDTIPEPGEISAACVSYCAINELTDDFIGSIGVDHFITDYDGGDPEFYTQENEKYCNEDMSDHGIYIAGIIQRLSPHASLHLIEVLNSAGAGTTNSLLWGFQQIQYKQKNKATPFIVNCSLTTKIIPHTFDLPGRIELIKEYTGVYDIIAVFYAITRNQELFSCLSDMIEFMHRYDCFIVAAAGNDSEDFYPFHNSPGFPALLGDYYGEKVIGVGACDHKGELTSYTNLPGANGLLAYGGEVDSRKVTIDGINSLYFSPVYGGISIPNNTGWARWAGSSFSAGVVSGTLAAILADGPILLPDARHKLNGFCNMNSVGMKFLPIF
jgi:hypothetical protein